ncbi:hypothetical protein PC41400_25845 [Paenibacillus chitinolyticus]|uniref:Uncharacterized protein n=1 Tax=Paenibacillus chitinolyticus TaxID=79263 RepID=A0A410X2S7_9BACL|nr:hypothetical protein PC41400_25845 [Paenibacillus chitinolyticus]
MKEYSVNSSYESAMQKVNRQPRLRKPRRIVRNLSLGAETANYGHPGKQASPPLLFPVKLYRV